MQCLSPSSALHALLFKSLWDGWASEMKIVGLSGRVSNVATRPHTHFNIHLFFGLVVSPSGLFFLAMGQSINIQHVSELEPEYICPFILAGARKQLYLLRGCMNTPGGLTRIGMSQKSMPSLLAPADCGTIHLRTSHATHHANI
jgi:hypothetical protein